VIRGRWKLITSSGAIPRDQLYDFAADRGELRDRSGDHPDVVASLREALADFRSRSGSRTPLQVELDANDLETLRLLGYVE
jgi:hypothetical protein